MPKVTVFNFISLDGYFKGPNGDTSWHAHHAEEAAWGAEKMRSENILLFGRVTYELMASFWPTPMAAKNDPVMAAAINRMEKIVFSRTLKKAEWSNTRIIHDNIGEAIRALKQGSGKDMTILGSGSIVRQFAELGLIDEYGFMLDPVILGGGTSIFQGIHHPPKLKLVETHAFKSGNVLLTYRPAGQV